MLAEIYCEEFFQKKIEFKNTLNVVLGTNTGDNSIGKSTFMLIIDFVFGGKSYADSKDIIDNIGPHYIYFKFIFKDTPYYFCRNNVESNKVWICNEQKEHLKEISLLEYCSWLSKQYNINLPQLSFRNAVGRYIRVYGKTNCNEKRPLQYISRESDNDSIVTLLKLFNMFEIIATIEEQAKKSEEALKIYNKAQKLDFVSKISKSSFKKNTTEIENLTKRIEELASGLEYDLLDIDCIASEEAIQIKSKLSRAKRLRNKLKAKLSTIDDNNSYVFSCSKDTYNELLKYFPQVNIRHIEEVEEFHKKVSEIFKNELKNEKKAILSSISEYDLIINDYETKLKELIKRPNLSRIALEQHAETLRTIDKLRKENNSYLKCNELTLQKKIDKERLNNIKNEQLGILENMINVEMKKINDLLYKDEHNAPVIHFLNSSYQFITPNDTGTGIAYKGLITFDLAVLRLTNLPIIVHDSIILKQISDDAIENIMKQYISTGKQTFIAFDKQTSYTADTTKLLEEYSILKLAPNGKELFGKSWGRVNKTE